MAALDGVADDEARLRVFVQAYYDHFTVHEPGLSVCLRELRGLPEPLPDRIADAHSRAATSLLKRIIADGMASGWFRAFDPEACAYAIIGIIFGFLRLRQSTRERIGEQVAVCQVLDVYCAGLTAHPGAGARTPSEAAAGD